MSFINGSVLGNSDNSNRRSGHHTSGGCCSKGNWSGINIAAMVIGFILFWPLGLVVLYWNIRGRNLKDLPDAIQGLWARFFSGSQRSEHEQGENSVFDEYQQTQYDRIKEIKEEIKDRARRFNIFRADASRRVEEKEFKDFMSKNPDS